MTESPREAHSSTDGNGESRSTPESTSAGKATPKHPAPLPPPVSAGQPVQVAVGMQLLGQSDFHSLDKDIQGRYLELADELDRRQYDYYCRSLDQQSAFQEKSLDDGAVARRQGILALTVITTLGLLIGGGGTAFLLFKGEYQWGFTLLMAGLGIVGAFLGGAGLPGFVRNVSRGFRSTE